MVSAKGETIAVVRVRFDEGKANARIIAAAPDLLLWAKRALPYITVTPATGLEDDFGDAIVREELAAAIAKAEGR